MKRLLIALALVIVLMMPAVPVLATPGTTQDITVTATPALVAIEANQSSYDFGYVQESETPYTATDWCTIDNTSNIQTDQTISVLSATWEGGATDWTHDDTGTPGTNTVGLLANKGGTWGVGDVIVKYASPNYIAENQTADTDYSFGLKLLAPTTISFYTQQQITVRITAAPG